MTVRVLRSLAAVAVLAPVLSLVPALADAGDLDPAFGNGGTVSGLSGQAEALAVQPDQRIVVGGSQVVPDTSGKKDLLVARYTDRGAPDTTFGGGDGLVTIDLDLPDTRASGGNEAAADIALQADGRIVVVGSADEGADILVVRLMLDGSLDPSFGGGDGVVVTDMGGRRQRADAVVLQGDRILVGGTTSDAGTASDDFLLLRYDAAGNADTSFGDGGARTTDFAAPPDSVPRPHDQLADLVVDAGSIVAGGSTLDPTTLRTDFALARYGPDGGPDAAFGAGGTVTTAIREGATLASLAVHDGGKVVAAGSSLSPSSGLHAMTLVRYEDDGGLDLSFGNGGTRITKVGPHSAAAGVAADGTGRLLVAGTSQDPDAEEADFVLARYDATGELDPSFSSDGVAVTGFGSANDFASDVAVQAGRPLVAGDEERGLAMARYLPADDAAQADLVVTLTANPQPATVGEELTVNATVTNLGPGSAYDVVLSAGDLPAGAFLSAHPSQGYCTGRTSSPVCQLNSLVPGTAAAVALVVLPRAGAAITPAASITSNNDPSPVNNAASVNVQVMPGRGQWESLPGHQGDRRTGHSATLLRDGRVLVAGGLDESVAVLSSAHLFDPSTRSWAPAAPMRERRWGHTATLLADGRVLVAGGSSTGDLSEPGLDTAELYDPVAGVWSPVAAAMGSARTRHTATLLSDNRVLLVGGFFEKACRELVPRAAEVFDPAGHGGAGSWTPTGPKRFATVQHSAHRLPNGEVIVVGGSRGDRYQVPTQCPLDPVGQLAGAELFDPSSATWRIGPSPVIERGGHSGTSLADGRVLIAGGTPCGSGDCITPAVEIYDPDPGSWSPAAAMTFARSFASASLLPTGEVLVAGGQTPSEVSLRRGIGVDTPVHSSAEVYDPVDDEWRSAGVMAVPRQAQTATVLPTIAASLCAGCGAVLVTGGEDSDPIAVASNELYLPAPADSPPDPRPVSPPRPVVGAGAAVGYWLVGADGGVFSFGAPFVGSTGVLRLNAPVVAMAAAPRGSGRPPGYWLAGADGGVFAFGTPFLGSTGGLRLRAPVVAMAPTPSGRGYWLVGADGGVFAFGDAPFKGSAAVLRLNAPVVGLAPTESGQGYWLVGADGGVFAFGDAVFAGSIGGLRLRAPVVGMAAAPPAPGSRPGYWLVAADGGVFSFGTAPFKGSTGGLRLNSPVVGMTVSRTGQGYWLAAANGGVFAFGDAPFRGSTGTLRLNRPMVGMAAFSP